MRGKSPWDASNQYVFHLFHVNQSHSQLTGRAHNSQGKEQPQGMFFVTAYTSFGHHTQNRPSFTEEDGGGGRGFVILEACEGR